jgi:hypothetical protein
LFKARIRKAAAVAAGTIALVAGVTPAASASPASYNDCPAGQACLFSLFSGTGLVFYPAGCGVIDLRQSRKANWAMSYLTHDHPIAMRADGESGWVNYPAWSSGDFDGNHQGTYDWMDVKC